MFEKYRQTPEYKQVNHGMTLDEFKGIFWWEYIHRLLGRLIGIVFLLPLALVRSCAQGSAAATRWRLVGIFVLGGLQGGWAGTW